MRKVSKKTGSVIFTTAIILKNIKLPDIPLDMSVCDGSDVEDLEVKQEPMDSDKVKSEESPPGLKSEDLHSSCQDVLADAQLQRVTESGKLSMVEWGTQ